MHLLPHQAQPGPLTRLEDVHQAGCLEEVTATEVAVQEAEGAGAAEVANPPGGPHLLVQPIDQPVETQRRC